METDPDLSVIIVKEWDTQLRSAIRYMDIQAKASKEAEPGPLKEQTMHRESRRIKIKHHPLPFYQD